MKHVPRCLLALSLFSATIRVDGQSSDRRDGVLAADRAVADASSKNGFRAALMAALSRDATLLYPGAPVVRGSEKIGALLSAQPLLDSLSVRWRANDAVVSNDGEWGLTHGVIATVTRAPGDSAPRAGNYAIVWHRVSQEWRIVAAVHVAIVPPPRTVLPVGLGPTELPPLAPTGGALPFIEADLAFARMATTADPATAFRSFASPSAVTYSAQNGVRHGPDEIAAPFVGGPPVDWTWHPVVAGGSSDGAFGYTVGESRRRLRGDPAAQSNTSKYLSVWRRESDGSIKFLYDGGNARP